MKTVAVIPARYASARFPGKPLADILGKPMVWWVWNAARQVPEFDEVRVATEDRRVDAVCREYGIPVIMTSQSCNTPTDRVWEVSQKVSGDVFVFIGGDEPLLTSQAISAVVNAALSNENLFVANAMTTIKSPPEAIDFTNIKMVCNAGGDGLYCSRSPIPYPKGSLEFEYKKFVGICVFSREALDFYASTPRSALEITEECDLIRFIEHHKSVKFIDTDCGTLSVDTKKDLERVRETMRIAFKKGETDIAEI